MHCKLIWLIFLIQLIYLNRKIKACKVFCEECPPFKYVQDYYCCQDDTQTKPVVKSCLEATITTTATTESTTTTTTKRPGSTAWICPVDPLPRSNGALGSAARSSLPLTDCVRDSDCVSSPFIQKCCYDNGVGGDICKPAMPVP